MTSFTGRVYLAGLQSATRYQYRVWATPADSHDGTANSAPELATTETFVRPLHGTRETPSRLRGVVTRSHTETPPSNHSRPEHHRRAVTRFLSLPRRYDLRGRRYREVTNVLAMDVARRCPAKGRLVDDAPSTLAANRILTKPEVGLQPPVRVLMGLKAAATIQRERWEGNATSVVSDPFGPF